MDAKSRGPEWARDDFTQQGFNGRSVRYCAIDLIAGLEQMLFGWSIVSEEGLFEPDLEMLGGPHE